MTDFKLEVTREIDRSYQGLELSISNDKIREIAGFFVQNMNRVLSLSAFPLAVFNLKWMQLREAGELPTPSGAMMVSVSQPTSVLLPPSDAYRFSEVVEILVRRGLIENRTQVDYAVQAILSAMIIGTWTAFETMAGDLWEASVNESPDIILSQLAKTENEFGRQVQKIRLPLSVDEFKMSDYSVRGRLGSLLRGDQKSEIGFDKFDRIVDSYKKAFGRSFDSLNTGKDRSLFSLAQTRNVIAHRAGMADQIFLKSMVEITSPLPQFSLLQKDKRIPIDGELTRILLDGSTRASMMLIKDVDAFVSCSQGNCDAIT